MVKNELFSAKSISMLYFSDSFISANYSNLFTFCLYYIYPAFPDLLSHGWLSSYCKIDQSVTEERKPFCFLIQKGKQSACPKDRLSPLSNMRPLHLCGVEGPLENISGGSVVKNLPANAGDMGLIPGPGKIPHAAGQLRLCTSTTEPVL